MPCMHHGTKHRRYTCSSSCCTNTLVKWQVFKLFFWIHSWQNMYLLASRRHWVVRTGMSYTYTCMFSLHIANGIARKSLLLIIYLMHVSLTMIFWLISDDCSSDDATGGCSHEIGHSWPSTSVGGNNGGCQPVLSSTAKRPCLDDPSSPAGPSPEPLSPVLKQKEFSSTTYRLAIAIINCG